MTNSVFSKITKATPLNLVKWLEVETKRGGWADQFPATNVRWQWLTQLKTGKMRGELKLGVDVLAELGWHYKDIISVFRNPDDLYQLMLTKSTGGNGFTLGRINTKSNIGQLAMPLEMGFKIPKTKPETIEHFIYNGNSLVIALPRA